MLAGSLSACARSCILMKVTTKIPRNCGALGYVQTGFAQFVTIRMTRNSKHQKQKIHTWQGFSNKVRNSLYNFSQDKQAQADKNSI